jgi:hypothetical protein
MDILDKFLTEFAYKFDKGYPDMNNDQDVLLLESLISEAVGDKFTLSEVTEKEIEVKDDKEEEIEVKDDEEEVDVKSTTNTPQGGSQVYDDTIRNAIYGSEWEGKPIPEVKGKYSFNSNTFTTKVDSKDIEIWKKLYPISPPKVGKPIGSEGSKGVGNGEVALYWLYRFSKSASVEVGRDGDDPDLFFNGDGVEVKAWKSNTGIHKLGRFGADKENLNLLSIIFGFNALATIFGDKSKSKTINPTNFDGKDLSSAMEVVEKFKNLINNNAQLASDYPIFENIKQNTDRLYSSFSFENDESSESMAIKVASKVVLDKLKRKPGDGKHLVNVMYNGEMKFFYIEFEKLKSNSDFLKDFKIAQSAIAINFNKIWG